MGASLQFLCRQLLGGLVHAVHLVPVVQIVGGAGLHVLLGLGHPLYRVVVLVAGRPDLGRDGGHILDLLDARMFEMDSALKNVAPGTFTERIWSLERRLYRRERAPKSAEKGEE